MEWISKYCFGGCVDCKDNEEDGVDDFSKWEERGVIYKNISRLTFLKR